jgi:hypothetical protein
MEINAMNIPSTNPRIAYNTNPTLNADPGPTRLTTAITHLHKCKVAGC